MLRCATALTLLALAAAAQGETLQCTTINSVPFTIAASGNYCLSGDLTSTVTGSNAAITIAADNVTLDLNDHSLIGPGGSNAGYGIFAVGQRYLRIRHGVLRGFSYGVNITDQVLPPAGIPIGLSAHHEVSDLTVQGARYGISMIARASSVHDNSIHDATQLGIGAGNWHSSGGDIYGNHIFSTAGVSGSTTPVYGIYAPGSGSTVHDNVVTTLRGPNGSAGIYVSGNLSLVTRNQLADIGMQDASNAVYVYACPSGVYVKFRDNVGYVNSSNSQPNINSNCPNGQFSGNF